MVIEWSDDYAIGIDKIDSQHKEFFALVHRLYEECLLSKGETVIEETLVFLRNYAIQHFRLEEELMREYAYPGIEEHLKLHSEFLEKYSEMMDDFKNFGPSQQLADQASDMVLTWFIDHIAEVDTLYAAHINKAS